MFAAKVEQWRPLATTIWPAREVENLLAVIAGESGGDPRAHNMRGEDSRGLLQINVIAHPQWAELDLFDPATNLRVGYELWRAQGWWPWTVARRLGLTDGAPAAAGAAGEDGVPLLLLVGLAVALYLWWG